MALQYHIKKSHISAELMDINEEQTEVEHLALAEKRNHLVLRLIAPPAFLPHQPPATPPAPPLRTQNTKPCTLRKQSFTLLSVGPSEP